VFMRVAMALCINEPDSIRLERVKNTYEMLSSFDSMVATPVFNAGTHRNQLSSCYVTDVDNSIEGIFDTYKTMSVLSKFGGGIGSSWQKITAGGGAIDGIKNVSSGVIPFLKITNDLSLAVDQLGCVSKDSMVKVVRAVEHRYVKNEMPSVSLEQVRTMVAGELGKIEIESPFDFNKTSEIINALFKSDDIASISASFNADIDILRVIKERVIQYVMDNEISVYPFDGNGEFRNFILNDDLTVDIDDEYIETNEEFFLTTC